MYVVTAGLLSIDVVEEEGLLAEHEVLTMQAAVSPAEK